jgi:transcriptional regulator with XRE-family HTH domain
MEARPLYVIGTNIRSARQRQGLSQIELANRSGVNISSIFRIEKGKSIRISTVAKISKGLDIVLDTVLSNRELPPECANVVVHRAANASWFAE